LVNRFGVVDVVDGVFEDAPKTKSLEDVVVKGALNVGVG